MSSPLAGMDEVPESLPNRPRSPIVIYMPSEDEIWSCDERDDTPTNLSPIWQSLPVELVQRVLHELVTIHLWEIVSDPFYPWETLRQLNRQQRRRIDALYRQLFLPIFSMARSVEFCLTDRPMERFLRVWRWDKHEAYDSTNDTIILPLSKYEHWDPDHPDSGDGNGSEDSQDSHDMHPSFDSSKGWNKYVNSFPPGGLYVNPEPYYYFNLYLSSRRSDHTCRLMCSVLKIPASHIPNVQDDSDDDSIKVSWSQLISALMRAWKKGKIEDERRGIWRPEQGHISLQRLRNLDIV